MGEFPIILKFALQIMKELTHFGLMLSFYTPQFSFRIAQKIEQREMAM